MAFAQLTYRESLRDIEACLRSIGGKLYHMGFRGKVARSTLADANESRDWRIYADFAQVLIAIARPLYAHDPIGVDLDQSLYALDSTTIDLCLSLFPWAKFRRHKAAVKMHTLLDLHGNIPTFIRITDGKVHDVNILDEIMPEVGAFYVMDRGYIDFQRLFVFTLCSAFFVVRTKENVLLQRRYSHPVDKTTGVRSDHTVILTSFASASVYPDALRRVTYLDAETREIEYLRRHDEALQRIMNTVEMPDRLAENLLMFIRQNKGELPKRRRTGEFKNLTDAEVASIEAIVGEAFEGFGRARAAEGNTDALKEENPGRALEFPAPEEKYVFDGGIVMFWGQDRETRVLCAISREALDDHFRGDNKDQLEVFKANRQAIEREARRKYLAGETEPDRSVLIRTGDLQA
jgi:hypothetical protein